MIEIVMIFALGFLAATFIALLIIPAINQRAERLARRRAEALFPMSIAELTAEKDHLRAEFAVAQRRIEQKAESALAFKHESMEELGRRAMKVHELDNLLADRDATVARLDQELIDLKQQLAETGTKLANTAAALADYRATLASLESTHVATVEELANMRRERDEASAALSVTRADLTRTSDALDELEEGYAGLDSALTVALSEIDAKRISISDLETRLMTQTARGDDFERALGERHAELTEERQRLTALAKSLRAEQERGQILEQRIREIENERDAAQTLPAGQDLASGNAELRQSIRALADQIMASAPSPSPVGESRPAKPGGKGTGKRKRTA